MGARVRGDMQPALERLLDETVRLEQSDDASVRSAAEAIAAAARDMAARLSRFEEQALEILAAETDPAGAAAPAAVPAPRQDVRAGEGGASAPQPPPSQLTRALAGELTQLARHAERPTGPGEADLLRPHIRRAARLANLWLTSSATLGPPPSLPVSAGTTGSYGPRPNAPARPPRSRQPDARVGSEETPVVMLALSDRITRLQLAYAELEERASRGDRRWREAIHELRNAAHAFTSWLFVLRGSELKDAPWFPPLVRAAEAVLRRAEEGLSADAADQPLFAIRTSEVALAPLTQEALESIRPMADGRNLTLAATTGAAPGAPDAPVRALADPDRVQQILYNLLRNAVQATPRGGSIAILVGRDERSAFIEVHDSGPGVADDIFDTLPAGRRTAMGFGVGLRLSRELALRMGGSLVTAPAAPDGGARFVLRLPEAPS